MNEDSIEDLLELIININDEIGYFDEDTNDDICLILETSGYNFHIKFLDNIIWKHYDDERKIEITENNKEAYEPLENYLKKQVNKIIDTLQLKKFKI